MINIKLINIKLINIKLIMIKVSKISVKMIILGKTKGIKIQIKHNLRDQDQIK